MQSKEEIMKRLDFNGVSYVEPACGDLEYNRKLEIECFDCKVVLEWWSNIGYVFIGEIQIPFNKISVDGCWPNKFKLNINLFYMGNKTAIIPVKEY